MQDRRDDIFDDVRLHIMEERPLYLAKSSEIDLVGTEMARADRSCNDIVRVRE